MNEVDRFPDFLDVSYSDGKALVYELNKYYKKLRVSSVSVEEGNVFFERPFYYYENSLDGSILKVVSSHLEEAGL